MPRRTAAASRRRIIDDDDDEMDFAVFEDEEEEPSPPLPSAKHRHATSVLRTSTRTNNSVVVHPSKCMESPDKGFVPRTRRPTSTKSQESTKPFDEIDAEEEESDPSSASSESESEDEVLEKTIPKKKEKLPSFVVDTGDTEEEDGDYDEDQAESVSSIEEEESQESDSQESSSDEENEFEDEDDFVEDYDDDESYSVDDESFVVDDDEPLEYDDDVEKENDSPKKRSRKTKTPKSKKTKSVEPAPSPDASPPTTPNAEPSLVADGQEEIDAEPSHAPEREEESDDEQVFVLDSPQRDPDCTNQVPELPIVCKDDASMRSDVGHKQEDAIVSDVDDEVVAEDAIINEPCPSNSKADPPVEEILMQAKVEDIDIEETVKDKLKVDNEGDDDLDEVFDRDHEGKVNPSGDEGLVHSEGDVFHDEGLFKTAVVVDPNGDQPNAMEQQDESSNDASPSLCTEEEDTNEEESEPTLPSVDDSDELLDELLSTMENKLVIDDSPHDEEVVSTPQAQEEVGEGDSILDANEDAASIIPADETMVENESILDNAEVDETVIEDTPGREKRVVFSPEPEVFILSDEECLSDGEDVLEATVLEEEPDSLARTAASRTPELKSIPEKSEDHSIAQVDAVETPNATPYSTNSLAYSTDTTPVSNDRSTVVTPASQQKSPLVSNLVAKFEKTSSKSPVLPPPGFAQSSPIRSTPAKSAPRTNASAAKTRNHLTSWPRNDGRIKRGKWTMGSRIGIGSFGVVHVGMNTETGTLMAVKTFDVERAVMKDVKVEIELLRSLDHPNIVRYLGCELDRQHLHIFQEWVPAGSVSTMLSKFGPFPLPVVRSYLQQTLAGLAYLHANHILHRDIKGSNLLVSDEGIVKLADFGASKKLVDLKEDLMMSMTVRGTPYFMAPEVFEEKYSSKADMWAIGCVAYQMITGLPPWKNKGFTNPVSLFNHIKEHDGPPPMPLIGASTTESEKKTASSFEALVRQCYQKEPCKRPAARTLLKDPFFIEIHCDDDDIEPSTPSKGPCDQNVVDDMQLLLSSARKDGMLPPTSPSPAIVRAKSRYSSILSASRKHKSPFSKTPGRSSLSPARNTSNWPEWAKKKLEEGSNESNLVSMLDSLAVSPDSRPSTSIGGNPFARKPTSSIGSAGSSVLNGLQFIDAKQDPTFEI